MMPAMIGEDQVHRADVFVVGRTAQRRHAVGWWSRDASVGWCVPWRARARWLASCAAGASALRAAATPVAPIGLRRLLGVVALAATLASVLP